MAHRPSVGATGVCWDNSAAESFFGTLKNELVHRETYLTRRAARTAIAEYIEVFYNRQRLHSTLGYRTLEHRVRIPRNPERSEGSSIKLI
ncbi:transposase [Frankia sp. Hr75.2]|nr:transposase [Frankia sp. Hr75.2]